MLGSKGWKSAISVLGDICGMSAADLFKLPHD